MGVAQTLRELNLTLAFSEDEKMRIAENGPIFCRINIFLSTLWHNFVYTDRGLFNKIRNWRDKDRRFRKFVEYLNGIITVEFCCLFNTYATNEAGAIFMGMYELPCDKKRRVCPINKLLKAFKKTGGYHRQRRSMRI